MRDVTLGDIARIARCSKNTVSLALRGSRRISETKRQEIEAIALEMGYVPNLSARNLSSKKSGYIGVYTKTLKDAVRANLVHDLITGFGGTGLHPILGLGDEPDQEWHQASWIQAFRAMRTEAIVVVAEFSEINIDATPSSAPIVLIHCQPDPSLSCDYIALDRAEASFIGRKHLTESGRKSIIVFGSEGSTFSEAASKPADGIAETDVYAIPVKTTEELADTYFDYYTGHRDRYDAALFQDSGVAAGFLVRAVTSGINVPRDLAIVGYDFYPQAGMLKVGMTTIEQPLAALTHMAIRIIQKRVEEPRSLWVHEVLPHKLMVRESSAPLKKPYI